MAVIQQLRRQTIRVAPCWFVHVSTYSANLKSVLCALLAHAFHAKSIFAVFRSSPFVKPPLGVPDPSLPAAFKSRAALLYANPSSFSSFSAFGVQTPPNRMRNAKSQGETEKRKKKRKIHQPFHHREYSACLTQSNDLVLSGPWTGLRGAVTNQALCVVSAVGNGL